MGRAGLEEYLQRLLGYSLEGGNPERIVLLLYGIGWNGKSTLLKTVRAVLGDYAKRVDKKTFLDSGDGGTASPYLAQLPGLRFIYASETEEGNRVAVGLLKDMTGDEPVQPRALYRDPIEFTPEFTPWIGTNEKPELPAKDQATWDRVRAIPFDARVSDEDIDVNLGDELLEEGEGILAWLVEGHRKYCEDPGPDKFRTPDVVLNANKEYREEMDDFAGFLAYLEDAEAEGCGIDWCRTPLRERSEMWARQNDAPALNARRFKAQMEAHGYKVKGERHTWRRDGWTSSDDADLAASLEFDGI